LGGDALNGSTLDHDVQEAFALSDLEEALRAAEWAEAPALHPEMLNELEAGE